jgi:hypothetical protein
MHKPGCWRAKDASPAIVIFAARLPQGVKPQGIDMEFDIL